jgi:hypothetical protein
MAAEELGGRHQILKWPNFLTVFCFSPSCSTSCDGCGRTGRQASDLKVAKFPKCSLFQSIHVLHPAMAVEELGGRHQILKWPNSPTVLCFSPSCSTSRDGCGRTGRQASDLKVANSPTVLCFSPSCFTSRDCCGRTGSIRHQILKWPNSFTVLYFSPSCSTSLDGCGRIGRQASDLKVAKFPNCFLFQSILFYIPRWPWKNWEACI